MALVTSTKLRYVDPG